MHEGEAAAPSMPRLQDLLSVDMLQKVQDNFSAAVGVAIITVDRQGSPVTRPSGFCDFCKAVRTTPMRARCFDCDDGGGRVSMHSGEPSIYLCHCGLVDFAVPIIMRGQYLGAIISGQVKLRNPEQVSLKHIIPPDYSWQADAALSVLYAAIPVISYHKLRSAAYTLFYLAAYLVEESYSNTVQQDLHLKTLKLMEESKHRVELEKSLREAELQALSCQVNPHFLFNVLNAIGRLALKEKATSTEEMVFAFADLMRYVLRKSGPLSVPLHGEWEHVRNYLYIQQIRMGDRFAFSVDVPEGHADLPCPFMILQPLVENCINYAVEPNEAGGWITIRAREDGKDLLLEVTDNGPGMSAALITAALAGTVEHHGRASIGLHNVHSRLRHFFGPEYGLEILSPVPELSGPQHPVQHLANHGGHDGPGTRVSLRIPLHPAASLSGV